MNPVPRGASSRLVDRNSRPNSGLWLGLGSVFMALWAAAGGNTVALGLTVFGAGLALIVSPPSRKLPIPWVCFCTLWLLLAGLQLVPGTGHWAPDWHEWLSEAYGFPLASSYDPQPWIGLDFLVILFCALSVFSYWLASVPDPLGRHQLLRVFAAGLILFSAFTILAYGFSWKIPLWASPTGLGPFANRNQLGSVLACSAPVLLAITWHDFKYHGYRGIFWLVGLGTIFGLLILNYSRAGLVLFFLGMGLWVAINAEKKSGKRVAIGLALLGFFLTAFLVFGGPALERFLKISDHSPSGRWLIQKDCLAMIQDQPWWGVGGGSFSGIFPIYRDSYQEEFFVRHPESDWLWLGAEYGVVAIILCAFLLFMWAKLAWPCAGDKDRRFRSACWISGSLFAVHGFVDVSCHRFGAAWPVLFLAVLAVNPDRLLLAEGKSFRIWKILGGTTLVAGASWMAEGWGGIDLPGLQRTAAAIKNMPALASKGQFSEIFKKADQALVGTPLAWELYDWRAQARLSGGGDAEGALGDFRRARVLESASPDVPLAEAKVWLKVKPEIAFTMIPEIFKRSERRRIDSYEQLLQEIRLSDAPDLEEKLSRTARGFSGLEKYYWKWADITEFDQWFERESGAEKNESVSKEQFWSLVRQRKGDDFALAFLEGHPHAQKGNFDILADLYAGQGRYREACILLGSETTAPTFPSLEGSGLDEDKARLGWRRDRGNFVSAWFLLHHHLKNYQWVAARSVIEEMDESKGIPPYFRYAAFEIYSNLEDWEKAYSAMKIFRLSPDR